MVILIFFLALDLISVPSAAETLEAPAEIVPLIPILVSMGIVAVEIAIPVMFCQIPQFPIAAVAVVRPRRPYIIT
jgi:hypothetical protein